jgi:hypothetical protein
MTTIEEKTQYYKDILLNNKCSMIFKKVDGSLRDGVFTLQPHLIPEVVSDSESKNTKVFKDGNLPIYEVTTNNWRSFNVERLVSIQTWDEEDKYWIPVEILD